MEFGELVEPETRSFWENYDTFEEKYGNFAVFDSLHFIFQFFVVVLFVLQKSRSSEIGMEMDGR